MDVGHLASILIINYFYLLRHGTGVGSCPDRTHVRSVWSQIHKYIYRITSGFSDRLDWSSLCFCNKMPEKMPPGKRYFGSWVQHTVGTFAVGSVVAAHDRRDCLSHGSQEAMRN